MLCQHVVQIQFIWVTFSHLCSCRDEVLLKLLALQLHYAPNLGELRPINDYCDLSGHVNQAITFN